MSCYNKNKKNYSKTDVHVQFSVFEQIHQNSPVSVVIKLLLKVAPVLHCSVTQMGFQHQTSPGPEYMPIAVTVVYWRLGISLNFITTEITVEHIAVRHIMG